MTKGRFVLMWLGIALVLAGWGLGIAWGYGQPAPKGISPWQGVVIFFGPIGVALLGIYLYLVYLFCDMLSDAYRSLPSGRELRRRKLEQRAAEIDQELARLEREAKG